MATARVVIVGAGPAGVRCAETLLAAGIKPILLDENRRDGGQIYRRQPEGFTRDYATLYGSEAAKAQDLHRSFDRLRAAIDYRPDTLVWNLTPGQLCCVSQGRHTTVDYDALILCTGATDRLMPIDGWQLAGTYSLGGAQIALKNQAVSIGHRVLFMGSGPLLYLVASQYVKAGANVAAVLDTSPLSLRIKALPKLLARPGVLFTGIRLLAQLYRAKVAVHLAIKPLQVMGDASNGVMGVRFSTGNGRTETVQADAVALGYHLRPETQLGDLADALPISLFRSMAFDQASSQWWLATDDVGRTSVKGVYAAGDGAKIRGADAAEHAGRLVALALLEDLEQPLDTGLRDEQQQAISAGELRRTVNEKGACEVNRAKAFSRVGMGRCQGRYCSQAGAEVIAAEAGVSVQEVGRQRGQAPVKPLSMLTEEAGS